MFKSIVFGSCLFILIFTGCIPSNENKLIVDKSNIPGIQNLPPQPDEDSWYFIEDLKSPMWSQHPWGEAVLELNQVDLSSGVEINIDFPDHEGWLETAYNDLNDFLVAGNIPLIKGGFRIEIMKVPGFNEETFQLEVRHGKCIIKASDTEGMRRGIYYLEDEMLRLRGPFLTIGVTEKEPAIKRRISRCFFGPIKRFPAMRDELMDDVDYYPDQYLNRLAYEGINGLWLTVEFKDLVSTKITPDAGRDAEKRLAKLRQTVKKCLRYGIRTYIFCIEPRAWNQDDPIIKEYPELCGQKGWHGMSFCPMSETAYDYLYESVNKIFKAVPDLGGLINISHGEMQTICTSTISSLNDYEGRITCPRCIDKKPWEVLHASLSAMEKGMHSTAPNAELISWLYMPDPIVYSSGDPYLLADWVYDFPAHTPEGVILQFNFESGLTSTKFGKLIVGGDYWISNPGPSSRFKQIAEIAKLHKTKISAKIQSGNSHEVATIPYIPVPSSLYKKFKAMHKLGVSHSMLCWYFGSYPGMMNKATGILSMKPFPRNEEEFMDKLASIYWRKEDVTQVTKAWRLFNEGFLNYPLINRFQWYGPMHDGPVWPLLLKPLDLPLSPSWEIGSISTHEPWPPSGDRIGECVSQILTLNEVVEMAKQLIDTWDKGVDLLDDLESKYTNEPERLLDIGVAKALGIQFRSGYNILRFYLLREEMLRMKSRKRLDLLQQITEIINEEFSLDKDLLELCKKDSRLGFHSEAEGYKYFPKKIEWRMDQLKTVLAEDIPEIKKQILSEELLFPEYTGEKPVGMIAYSKHNPGNIWDSTNIRFPQGLDWQSFDYSETKTSIKWASMFDKEALYIVFSDSTSELLQETDWIRISIESRRLWPVKHFDLDIYDIKKRKDDVRIINNNINYLIRRIPFKNFLWKDEELHPIRLDIQLGGIKWRPSNPVTNRLTFGTLNPADLGWLLFKEN